MCDTDDMDRLANAALILSGIAAYSVIVYLMGYNQGFNNGHKNALEFEPACKQVNYSVQKE